MAMRGCKGVCVRRPDDDGWLGACVYIPVDCVAVCDMLKGCVCACACARVSVCVACMNRGAAAMTHVVCGCIENGS